MKRLVFILLFSFIWLSCKKDSPKKNNSLYGNWKTYHVALVNKTNTGKTETELIYTPNFYDFNEVSINENKIIWQDIEGNRGIWNYTIQTESSTKVNYIQLFGQSQKYQYTIENNILTLKEFLEPSLQDVERGIRYSFIETKLKRL